jgi:hypothetical protein
MELLQHYPDHFVVGIDNLETGIDQFEALTGVRAVAGGVHPHIGTCNALLSIGEQSYLEIIAPDPGADTARLHPQLKALFTDPLADMATLTPYLWAVGSRDLDDTVSKLAAREIYLTEPAIGARQKPDGQALEWRASFIEQPLFPAAPFFIEWLDPSIAPPSDSPKGCTLEEFSLAGPEVTLLETVTKPLGLNTHVSFAPEPSINITLNTPKGIIHLPGKEISKKR